MKFSHLVLAGALALVTPGLALAQPAPHHAIDEEIQVDGDVFVTDDGDVMIQQNRSNVFRVVQATWAHHLLNAGGERVSAKLKVVQPGVFGGDVEVLDLVRDVKGEVQLPMGGAPMISMNRSNVFQVERGTAWERVLLNSIGEVVEARVRVLEPGMFGGKIEVVSLVREVAGEVSLPMGGGPIISVNRSNLFQVQDQPFRSVLAGCVGRRVEARVRLVEPGMFGGKVEVETLKATNPSSSKRLLVRGRPSSAAPVVAMIAPGKGLTIIGATRRYFRVELKDGRRGYVLRTAAEIGERVVGLTGSIPQ